MVEARRLFELVDRPNLMVKVPATSQGIGAISELIAAGVNINATLIFSLGQYKAVAHAYIQGLAQLIERGGDPKKIASVASFFVSRVDTVVDERLKEFSGQASRSMCVGLIGKTAIANATLAYEHYREILDSKEWRSLEKRGQGRRESCGQAQVQRTLRMQIRIMLTVFSGPVPSTLCRQPR